MIDTLTKTFTSLISSLSGKKKLSEENISDAVRQVRLALLDADVNYSVVSEFIKRVKEKALGDALLKSVSPGDQFIEIVHKELIALMGSEEKLITFSGMPTVLLLCGLQGAGKTTMCAKLAHYLQKQKKRTLVAACDLQRPAAVLQLEKLCRDHEIAVHSIPGEAKPIKVVESALTRARKEGFEVLILDTAGRLHIDESLMKELVDIKKAALPHEILFVANAASGQDAVKTALEFDARLGITGSILTMLDGSARAGAAISIAEVTGRPLKFEGIGEKIEDIQVFHPQSMADRILGMGDVINLVKKAKEHVNEDESALLEKKMRKATFTYDDYLKQMGMMKKMGPLKNLLKMMPGASQLGDLEIPEKEFRKTEAIIQSMTQKEREERVEFIPSRRRRVALGSGTTVDDVNRLVKGFKRLKQICKSIPNEKSMSKMMKSTRKENMLWQ